MLTKAQQVIARTMTERELQRSIIQLVHALDPAHGLACHFRPARAQEKPCSYCGGTGVWLGRVACPACKGRGKTQNWATPLEGDPGIHDLIICLPPRFILAELKRPGQKAAPPQKAWHEAVKLCPGVEHYVWTPADWISGEIERVFGNDGVGVHD